MKKVTFLILMGCLYMLHPTFAQNKLDIKTITDGKLAAQRMSGIIPIDGTDQYARIENDGTQIKTYSFKTGKETGILFDAKHTQGETIKRIDGYIMSPTGGKMLIQTNTKPIYRRSFTADYYIYTIASRKLERLSDGGPQQVPTWSPDGNLITFVRENNIYLVKLLYNNSESQVTKDGKFNEIINGIPDWVNEEEFSFNKSLCFNADGTMICW
ncbi:MAG: DPP IV N-terminal domain-containing protein, partial [Prevotella sp.]|nr:DPP IV N-terminal domain-containing protein [Prevotella sp.]